MIEFESASLRSIQRLNPKLLDEVKERLGIDDLSPEALKRGHVEAALDRAARRGGPRRITEAMVREVSTGGPRSSQAQLEAIVVMVIRPPLLVQRGTFVPPTDPVPEVAKIIGGLNRDKINSVIAKTARVELVNVANTPFVGTAWIVQKPTPTKAVMVTNRHVAQEFARADGRGGYFLLTLPNYREYIVQVDFHEEHMVTGAREAPVMNVVFMAGDNAPDIALIEVEHDLLAGLEPISFSDKPLEVDMPIGVVGYPAFDSRNDANDVAAYFGDIFNVKRFAFGNVTGIDPNNLDFVHDATTLGGNSGSVVFDRETGNAVGLHYAGEYRKGNYAVPVRDIQAALMGLKSTSVVRSAVAKEAADEKAGSGPRNATEHFKGRDGYQPGFLDPHQVQPPKPGEYWENDLTEVVDSDTGGKASELKYRHFSVWMCKSRKLPLLTAVNVNGADAKRMGRVDKWYIDGRVDVELQVGNAAYASNPLDRGHMVRREDPVWGTMEVAAEANRDTFHYTNCAPQHEHLNQRDWVNLEDYILGNARTRGLKVSVFTGPVFGDNDRIYKNVVKLPESFWKIAAIIDDETGKLSVTGYLLSQGDLIKGLTGEFVYGSFRAYQVEVSRIGELARLDVTHLAEHDPLAKQRRNEGVAGDVASFRVINGSADLVL